MAPSEHRPSEPHSRPAGVEGDGMDRYPTYKDAASTSQANTGTKPTDSNLPRSRRTWAVPLMIGLAVFALVLIVRIVWGGINMGSTADEALTPGDPATPPPAASTPTPAGGGQGTVTGTEQPESPGSLDRDVQPQTQTSPGEVETTPGAVDVPGGDTTTPVQPAPAQ